jgi:hypothetical protein
MTTTLRLSLEFFLMILALQYTKERSQARHVLLVAAKRSPCWTFPEAIQTAGIVHHPQLSQVHCSLLTFETGSCRMPGRGRVYCTVRINRHMRGPNCLFLYGMGGGCLLYSSSWSFRVYSWKDVIPMVITRVFTVTGRGRCLVITLYIILHSLELRGGQ